MIQILVIQIVLQIVHHHHLHQIVVIHQLIHHHQVIHHQIQIHNHNLYHLKIH
jgi:hypothetical protein